MRVFILIFSFFLCIPLLSAQTSVQEIYVEEFPSRIPVEMRASVQEVLICGLDPDRPYDVYLNSGVGEAKLFTATNTRATEPGQHLKFKSTSECQLFEFQLNTTARFPQSVVFSINAKQKAVEMIQNRMMGISAGANSDATFLIEGIFIGGGCFDVFGSSFLGATNQAGTFGGGESSIGLESGVILSTGNVADCSGPNVSNSTSSNFGGATADPDLAILADGPTFDRAALDFFFTPTVDQINFQYAFASEEYCEYVGANVNDVFGFFISGPGMDGPYSNGGENIAVLGGGAGEVSIDNINHNSNSGLYFNNMQSSFGSACAPTDGVSLNLIEYDGYTAVLNATANVVPCQTYRIRLVIADVGDAIYDSAVFLKKNSFAAGNEVDLESSLTGAVASATGAYEGCGGTSITFTRGNDNVTSPVTVSYEIDVNSTATAGVDYTALPNPIIIPAGQMSVTYQIDFLQDAEIEGTETVIINLSNPCSCDAASTTFEIIDPDPLTAFVPDQFVCTNFPSPVSPSVSGGIPPYSYQWSTGETGPVIQLSINQPQSYVLTVTDGCGNTAIAPFNAYPNAPSGELSGQALICTGNPQASLNLTLEGYGPWEILYSANGVPTTATIPYSPYQLDTYDPGIYQLISVSSNGCPGEASGAGVVIVQDIVAQPAVQNASCNGLEDGAITILPFGGDAPYSYNWQGNYPDTSAISELSPGVYPVTVEDAQGCETYLFIDVEEPDELQVSVAEVQNVNCVDTIGQISLAYSGGTPGYSFLWSDGTTTTDSTLAAPAGDYSVTITDDSGCTDEVAATVEADQLYPDIDLAAPEILDCDVTSISLDGSGSDPGMDYLWVGLDGQNIDNANQAIASTSEPGAYELTIVNPVNGCISSGQISVDQDTLSPIASIAQPDTLNCVTTATDLDGSGSDSNMGYQWTTADGTIIGAADIAIITAGSTGTYQLEVSNPNNGCSKTTSVYLPIDDVVPTVVLPTPDLITCAVPSISLSSAGTDQGDDYTYSWSTANGQIDSGAQSPSPTVSSSGNYQLTVINTGNGCENSANVSVSDDLVAPDAEAGDPVELDCEFSLADLSGSGSSTGSQISYAWSTSDGFIQGDTTNLAITATQIGTYTLTVFDSSNGCSSADQVEVEENSQAPDAAAAVADILTCERTSIALDASGSDSGPGFMQEWSTPDGQIAFDSNTNQSFGEQPGTYTLTVTNLSNSCIATASVVVEENIEHPVTEAGPDGLLNCYEPDYTIDANGSDQGNVFNLSWTNENGDAISTPDPLSFDVSQGGWYYLDIQNTFNGCTTRDSVFVDTDQALPQPNAGATAELNCAQTALSLNGSLDAPLSNYKLSWMLAQNVVDTSSFSPSINEAGLYTLQVQNLDNGCLSEDEVLITDNFATPELSILTPSLLTCTDTLSSLVGQVTNTQASYEYTWTVLNGAFSNSPQNNQAQTNAPGSFQLIAMDQSSSCLDTAIVEVLQDIEAPSVNAGPTTELTCLFTTAVLAASADAQNDDFSVSWSTQDGAFTTNTDLLQPTVDAPGTYQILVTNTFNGCQSTDAVTITEDPDIPEALAGPDLRLDCNVPSLVLDGSASTSGSNISYTWQDLEGNPLSGGTNNQFSVSTPGWYVLEVENVNNNCVRSDSVLITIDTLAPVAMVTPDQIVNCYEPLATISAAGSDQGAGFSMNWYNGNNQLINTNEVWTTTTADIYRLEIVNLDNGCQSEAMTTITVDTIQPAFNLLTPGIVNCDEPLTTLAANGNFDPSWTMNWSGDQNQPIINAGSASASTAAAGNYQFTVFNPMNGCDNFASVTVVVDTISPGAFAGESQTLSCTETVTSLSGGSPTAGVNYAWTSTNGNFSGNTNVANPLVNAQGLYQLTVTNPVNGCTSTDAVQILENVDNPVLAVAPPSVLTCAVQESVLYPGVSNADTYQLVWSQNGSTLATSTTASPLTVSTPGTYDLLVTNQVNGCNTAMQVIVQQDIVTPTANAGPDLSLNCFTPSSQLDATASSAAGPLSYVWTTGEGNIISGANTAQPLVDQTGIYQVLITNMDNGCTSTDAAVVEVLIPDNLEVDIIQPPCHDDPAQVFITDISGGLPPYSYILQGANAYYDNETFFVLDDGDFNLIVEDANGCQISEAVQVVQPEAVEVVLIHQDIVKLGDSYQIDARVNYPPNEISLIEWTPTEVLDCSDCLDPVATPTQNTNFDLLVETINGCIGTASLLLRVDRRPAIYIPNAFSPFNNDGYNDRFTVYAKDNLISKVNKLMIFNRWGEPVYERENFPPNDETYGWDGIHRGEPMNPAVFVYWTEVELIDGSTVILKGDVTLVK